MTWKIEYRKQAYCFLKKEYLVSEAEEKILRFIRGEKQDVKRLKGKWQNYLRLRIGRVRIIFKIEIDKNFIEITKAGFRGKIYR
jgi:mRNA interferase RelE/StbE